ncbi:nucleotide disphospho-sugar-binding domain-containing protein [Spirillospora sp. NPDC048824]|uniref:nucleotide disphospho-sugar-binding domain-containing protein n=1 Tax=Spirillospora sp. NPDC048824 TaxID=3364526 RepID=UPI00371BBAA4
MRVIFATWAWPSHLYAMVPLAWACRAAGHEVLIASEPELTGTILRTGLPAAPVGRDVDAVAVFRDIVHPPEGRPGKGGGGPRVLGLLGDLAESMTGDLVKLAEGWRADLIVYEPTAFAGPLAAAAVGVPAVRHLYGADLLSGAGRFLPDVLAPMCEKLGLDGVEPFGAATVDPCPAGLQVPTGSRRLPMRYVPYNGPGVLPPPSPRPAARRPRVCVTWGTTYSRLDPRLFLAGDAVRAIAGLPVDVIVAVAPGQRDLLGTLPPEAHVVEGAPLHLLLPRCDAVIAQGGAGTILTALDSGLPQVLVPRLPDHVRHAARIAETNAGVVLPAPGVEAAAIRDGLTAVLDDPAHRDAARALRDEMRDQPPPARVVAELAHIGVGTTTGR